METWDALLSRRNIRGTDRPFRATIWTASSRRGDARRRRRTNNARDLVVVTDRTHLVDLARVRRGAGHVAGSAATIALVVPTIGPEDARADPVRPGPGEHGHAPRRDRPRHLKRPRGGGRRTGPCPATPRPTRRPVRRLAHRARLPRGSPAVPGAPPEPAAVRTGGSPRSVVIGTITLWRSESGGPRSGAAAATGEAGPQTQPWYAGQPRRGAEVGDRPSRTRPWSSAPNRHRALPATPGPRDGSQTAAHRALRGMSSDSLSRVSQYRRRTVWRST